MNSSIERIFILSELGERSAPLLGDIIPLLRKKNRQISYDALEIIMVCSIGEKVKYPIYVLEGLESEDKIIRKLAMRLISRVEQSRIEVVFKILPPKSIHNFGLINLRSKKKTSLQEIKKMLQNVNVINRRYASIIAYRTMGNKVHLIDDFILSSDVDIIEFIKEHPTSASM